MATVYSYVRFSSKKQEQGDSVRRQLKAGDDWLSRNPQHTLDASVRLHDLGVSAFRGANLDEKGVLGAFIALAKKPDSPIAKGSILLIERLDRFSRQQTRKAYRAFVELVEAGITVQTLDPPQTINEDNVDDLHVVLPLILQMTMAHEQSREKSRRVGSVWEAKREEARKGKPMFRRCPGWLEWNHDEAKFVPKPDAVRAIQYAFERTADGCGQKQLTLELNKHFRPLGQSGKWNGSYVQKILSDRAVLGELQPHTFNASGDRVPVGEPLVDYYPRVINDELFYTAGSGKAARKKAKGPNSQFVNLFVGLLVGSDSHALHIQTSRSKRPGKEMYLQRRLFSYGHLRGLPGACSHSVNYYAVEATVLRILYELDETSLAPRPASDGQALALEQKIAAINRRIADLRAALTDTDPAAQSAKEITEALARLADQLQQAEEDHAGAKQDAQVDPQKAVLHARELVVTLQTAPEQDQHALRLRLRSMISRLVKTISVDIRKVGRRSEPVVTVEMHSGEKRVLIDGRSSAANYRISEQDSGYRVLANEEERAVLVSVTASKNKRAVEKSDVGASCVRPFTVPKKHVTRNVDTSLKVSPANRRKPR